jgi:hypothetical protein
MERTPKVNDLCPAYHCLNGECPTREIPEHCSYGHLAVIPS